MIIRHLLWPKTQGLRNRWKRAKNTERLLIVGFSAFGALFWVGLSALFWYFIKTFYGIEIVGPIVLRKLMELLMLSLFGMLVAAVILAVASGRIATWNRVLEWQPLAHLGKVSFGAYLLHAPVLVLLYSAGLRGQPWLGMLAATALTWGIATLTWRRIEAPILGWKDRLAPY